MAGRAEASRLALAEAARFTTLLDACSAAVNLLEQEVGTAVLDLALDVARQVLRSELAGNPEAILPAIREALDLAGNGAQAQLLLHPGDVSFVKQHLHDLLNAGQWRVTEDPGVDPGGCRIITGSGSIDATIATRWQRVSGALGKRDAW